MAHMIQPGEFKYDIQETLWRRASDETLPDLELGGTPESISQEAFQFIESLLSQLSAIAETAYNRMMTWFLNPNTDTFKSGLFLEAVRVIEVDRRIELIGDLGDPYFRWTFHLVHDSVTRKWNVWKFSCQQQ